MDKHIFRKWVIDMKVVITGTAKGIGLETARVFLEMGHDVIGIDELPQPESLRHRQYKHVIADVSDESSLPHIPGVQILINNAGVQNDGRDISVNLLGTVNCTEKYGIQPHIKSIVNVASTSAHTGAEFPLYAASKGGVLAYTKNVAMRVAKHGATCNSISPGGVITEMNEHIIKDEKLWAAVMNETLLPKWATAHEIAMWIYFVACMNSSMTGQDIIIDNGEMAKSNFIW